MEFVINQYNDELWSLHTLPSMKILTILNEKELNSLNFKIEVALREHETNKKENV